MATPAASSALAVTGYRRAALSSHTSSSPMPVATPIRTRTGGWSQPCSTEYRRNSTAANTKAIAAMAEKSFTPTRPSQSNAGRSDSLSVASYISGGTTGGGGATGGAATLGEGTTRRGAAVRGGATGRGATPGGGTMTGGGALSGGGAMIGGGAAIGGGASTGAPAVSGRSSPGCDRVS